MSTCKRVLLPCVLGILIAAQITPVRGDVAPGDGTACVAYPNNPTFNTTTGCQVKEHWRISGFPPINTTITSVANETGQDIAIAMARQKCKDAVAAGQCGAVTAGQCDA